MISRFCNLANVSPSAQVANWRQDDDIIEFAADIVDSAKCEPRRLARDLWAHRHQRD
jgi:hypothetical protein